MSWSGTFRVKVQAPVHVGMGDRLQPIDYDLSDGWFVVKDVDAFLRDPAVPQDRKLEVVSQGRARAIPVERYRLALETATDPQHDVLAFFKDDLARPMIPGSSLKGAIRQALAWRLVQEFPAARLVSRARSGFDAARGRSRAERCAEALSKELFGRSPNHDLLRGLVIRDPRPLSPEHLELREIRVVKSEGGSLHVKDDPKSGCPMRIFVEVLRMGAVLDFPFVVLDTWAHPPFPGEPASEFEFGGAAGNAGKTGAARFDEVLGSVASLDRVLRDYGADRLKREAAYFENKSADFAAVSRFLSKLGALSAEKPVFPIGFGTGWIAKTVASDLEAGLTAELVKAFRLDRGRDSNPFPKSRKLFYKRTKTGAGFTAPLGWVSLEVRTD